MLVLALATFASTTSAALDRFFPCTPGLAIEYLVESKDAKTSVRMIETVRGLGKEPRTCVIDRLTLREKGEERDAWAREHLADRVTNAGWVESPTAFRPPLMVAPIERGKRWRFNTSDYEIADVGDTYDVPAGTFEGCVRVEERSRDGKYAAYSVYAPGVGLIAHESRELRTRATKVETSRSKKEKKSAGSPR